MVFLAERVFLLVHIGFAGVHSSEVSRGFFWYKTGGFFGTTGGGGRYKVVFFGMH